MPRVDPEQRKAAITAAAFALIARDGIEAATMRQVATAAGATTGRVTHHFSSRVDLLVAALAEVDRRRTSRIATHTGLEPSARLKAVLLELLPLDTARLDEQRVWASLCTTGIPELRDEVRHQTAQRDRLVGALIAQTHGHQIDNAVAFSLLALVDGIAHRLMLQHESTQCHRRLPHHDAARRLASSTDD